MTIGNLMSKNYAITRIKKHTSIGALAYLVNHHLRLTEVQNADPKRAHLNEVLIQKDDIQGFIADTPKGSKRNACRLVDVLFSASEFTDKKQAEAWQKATLEFARKEFGEHNIALAVVHNDETSKHMHIVFKPVNPKTQKLGAGHWFDGRVKMQSYQDRYHQAVASLGFDRGEPGSRANHKTIKQFYRDIDLAEKAYKSFKEDLLGIAKEVKKATIWDRLTNPKGLAERVLNHLDGIGRAAKTILLAKEVLGVKKKEKDNDQLREQIENLSHKLNTITGDDNPSWVEIQRFAEHYKTQILPQEGPKDAPQEKPFKNPHRPGAESQRAKPKI